MRPDKSGPRAPTPQRRAFHPHDLAPPLSHHPPRLFPPSNFNTLLPNASPCVQVRVQQAEQAAREEEERLAALQAEGGDPAADMSFASSDAGDLIDDFV